MTIRESSERLAGCLRSLVDCSVHGDPHSTDDAEDHLADALTEYGQAISGATFESIRALLVKAGLQDG